MSPEMNRRLFIKGSLLSSAGLSLGSRNAFGELTAKESDPPQKQSLPKGKIGNLQVSRLLLGGNLLTHFTHSRDLKYVYNLAAHYNTEEKILETLALAETSGVDTLSIHIVPQALDILKKHRKRGGKMKWIICPTAPVTAGMNEYSKQVRQLLDDGTEAIYLWGVHGDNLTRQGKVDLIAEAVQTVKDYGVLSGVGAHDLDVIKKCEENKIGADFYIKTFHHHNYPTGPKPDELTKPYKEYPGYWCDNPQEVIDFMKTVDKPWIAFKVMAAGAIPPEDAFKYTFENGADHILAGMFDFEIEEDVRIANEVLSKAKRVRPWRS